MHSRYNEQKLVLYNCEFLDVEPLKKDFVVRKIFKIKKIYITKPSM
jgi:hypothetical protein